MSPQPVSRRLRVAVLFGGRSAEHEISLVSARNILAGLDPERYEIIPIGIDRAGRWHRVRDPETVLAPRKDGELPAPLEAGCRIGDELVLRPGAPDKEFLRPFELPGSDADPAPLLGPIDVVFPVLHGPFGEDGGVQGLLKVLDAAWVGPGVLGSAVGMDKDVMKRLLCQAEIPNARFQTLRRGAAIDPDRISQQLAWPVYVKPANLGSSVGVSRARNRQELERAIDEAFEYDHKVLVEENIEGREIECAVLGGPGNLQASVVGEIRPTDGFYSYKAKYIDADGAALEIPAQLPETVLRRVQSLSLRVCEVLELEGMTRVDLFWKADGQLYVNEVNTIPGFTSISMYPGLWKASGLPLPQLLDRLIELALERRARDQALRSQAPA